MKASTNSIKQKLATNIVLGVLTLSVGALCLSPTQSQVTAGEEAPLYRDAGERGQGVSLTFNVYEGTEVVYRILDILREHNATATFFIGGCWADDNTKCLRDIYAAGHEIGNHGYFHKDHAKLNFEQNVQEITACNTFIELAIGVKPTLFAPPSGSLNKETLLTMQSLRMTGVLWSKDTIDWRDRDKALVYARATKDVKIGDFILMHPMKETADALPDILHYYEAQGLETVTVSTNLRLEG